MHHKSREKITITMRPLGADLAIETYIEMLQQVESSFAMACPSSPSLSLHPFDSPFCTFYRRAACNLDKHCDKTLKHTITLIDGWMDMAFCNVCIASNCTQELGLKGVAIVEWI